MRDYYDFSDVIVQRVNELLSHHVENYEQKHHQHLRLTECELSVWLDINRDTKDMCLNLLILDDKREVEINGKELIKPEDDLYSECKRIYMHQLENFYLLFDTEKRREIKMEMFNFRIINMKDGSQVIDQTIQTPYASLTLSEMIEYIETDKCIAIMDAIAKKRQREEERQRKLARNPFRKIACMCGLI